MSANQPGRPLERPKFKVTATFHPAARTAEFVRYADNSNHAVSKVRSELEAQGYTVSSATAEEVGPTGGEGGSMKSKQKEGDKIWLREFVDEGVHEPRQQAEFLGASGRGVYVVRVLGKLKRGDDGLREVTADQIE